MSIVIKVENLSKAYQIGQFGTGTISKDVQRWLVTKVMRKEDPFLKIGETNDRTVKGSSDIVWSLKDINFETKQGEVIGIIGKNGAGKSTLLKVLTRITSPTTGKIKIKGRIASLLEVGTGFHPELTGRENIYLNGSILGMRNQEITRKLDQIIDFSGVERYIDTPVKRYSSGMYVRLAFAVAAHLESETLFVDEVLAVGDAEFQKKCLGKMQDVSKNQGKTILFVSHNLGSLSQICTKGMLMNKGQLTLQGDIGQVINEYLKSNQNEGQYVKTELDPEKDIQVKEVFLTNENGIAANDFTQNETIKVHIKIHINKFHEDACYYIAVFNKYKERVASDVISIKETTGSDGATQYITYEIPANLLAPNVYSFWVSVLIPRIIQFDDALDICPIEVHDAGFSLSAFYQYEHGYFQLNGKWQAGA